MKTNSAATFDAHGEVCWGGRATETAPPQAGNHAADIAVTVYDSMAAVESDWRRFEETADCTVFQTFGWLAAWQEHVGRRRGVRPAIVIGRNGAGEILFIFPLAISRAGFARQLTWLGSDLCDYNAPLLAGGGSPRLKPEHFAAIWEEITQCLRCDPRMRYDCVGLEKMPATLGSQPNPMLSLGVAQNASGAYCASLGKSWDAFYAAKRSATTRRRDRSKRKRLAAFGEIRLDTPHSRGDALAVIETLMSQKVRYFARLGLPNLFARPGYSEFYRALATGDAAQGMVHVSALRVGPRIAAANLGLCFRGTYYHLLSSYSDGEVSRYGPGAIHLHELMRHAIERGCRTFDFTIGDEPYKLDWCETAQTVYNHFALVTCRGLIAHLHAIAFHMLKRLIKQTPVLWAVFSRLRAALCADSAAGGRD
jgi:CelD/BcsL family acetyltransferase involved in cellulose biosynthesis